MATKNGGGGGRVGDNNILTFASYTTGYEMPLSCLFLYTFAYLLIKETACWAIFSSRICKVS